MTDDTRQARAAMALGALDGLIRCAEDLLGKAQALAPVEEGTLRASAALTLIVNGNRYEGAGSTALARSAVAAAARAGQRVSLDAEVSFNTVYAARQHEELDWTHPKGGEAKYLEGPLRANAGRYTRVIAAAAERGL
jgi:hypothetical protein